MAKPTILAIAPPVYDFALYDLFLKPYGLLRVCAWLADHGFSIATVNALDFGSAYGRRTDGLGRRSDGTGRFPRQVVALPDSFCGRTERPLGERTFARYGIAPDDFASRICQARPDLALIGTGMTYWYPGVREAVDAVRAKHPGVPIVAGGVYASLMPGHCREACGPDDIIVGDAWPALADMLESYGLPPPKAPPPQRTHPAREVWREAGVLQLNSGCPFSCAYCAAKRIHPVFQVGEPAVTFESVVAFRRDLGIRNFAFYDDALLVRKEEAFIPFLRRVVSSGLDLSFHLPNAVHVHLIDEEVAVLMKKAGFVEVRLGLESASDAFHERYDQKASRDLFSEAVSILRHAGFSSRHTTAYVLAGLPDQEPDEVEDSIRFAAGQGVRVSVAEFSPVPGSPLWDRSVERSAFPIAEEPLFHNNSLLPLQSSRFTYGDLRRLRDLARRIVV